MDRSVFIFLICLQPLQCGHQTTTNSQASLLSPGFPNFTPPAKTRPATLMRPHLLCSDRAKSHVISYKEQTRNFSACCRQPLLYFPQNIFNCLRLLLYSLSMFLRFIQERVREINKMTTLAWSTCPVSTVLSKILHYEKVYHPPPPSPLHVSPWYNLVCPSPKTTGWLP